MRRRRAEERRASEKRISRTRIGTPHPKSSFHRSLARLPASRQWKERWAVLRFLFLLDFNLRYKQRRRDGGNRHAARFGAAVSVENFQAIGSRQDLAETGKRRTDHVGATNQL